MDKALLRARLRRASYSLIQPYAGSERRMVEPEVVATSPYRIKSPVPICCGFDSVKLACRAVARDVNQAKPPSLRYGAAASLAPTSQAKAGGRERTCIPPRRDSQILDLWGLLFPLNHSPKNWSPHSELHRAYSLTERMHR